MIDLDIYFNRTMDIKLKGKLVKVNEPTIDVVKKLIALEGREDSKALDDLVSLVTKILNNNTSAVKFTEKEVATYPISVLKAIMLSILNEMQEVSKSPN